MPSTVESPAGYEAEIVTQTVPGQPLPHPRAPRPQLVRMASPCSEMCGLCSPQVAQVGRTACHIGPQCCLPLSSAVARAGGTWRSCPGPVNVILWNASRWSLMQNWTRSGLWHSAPLLCGGLEGSLSSTHSTSAVAESPLRYCSACLCAECFAV